MDRQHSLSCTRLNSPVDFEYSLKLPILPVLNLVVSSEALNSDGGKAMTFEQNNMKESDIFSKFALEIEAGSTSHVKSEFIHVNVNTSRAMDSLSCLNSHQSKEDNDEFVVSDFVEDNNNCGSDQVTYIDISPGCSQEKCEVNWPVCKKYPECPICAIEIEQYDFERVSGNQCSLKIHQKINWNLIL